jgi:phosphoribosylaminoimidazole-succinocarboxamide synthase
VYSVRRAVLNQVSIREALMNSLTESSIPSLPLVARGKVRDVYAVGEDKLLMIATDRISAFDCVLGSPIPDKGRILTQISLFWFDLLGGIVPNHLITASVDEYPAELHFYRDQLEGRSMLVRRANMVDIECVARGYLAGSGWKEYRKDGTVCGIGLPPGLVESSQLPEPIFTPASKEQSGHDINISFEAAAEKAGSELASRLRELTLAIYKKAAEYALTRGIIIADTKFEFGFIDGVLTLGDEVLTPDSSRFWPAAEYKPGGAQPSFDKQYVRDYLETLDWNKQPPAPVLPDDVVAGTRAKYLDAYTRLTGKTL